MIMPKSLFFCYDATPTTFRGELNTELSREPKPASNRFVL